MMKKYFFKNVLLSFLTLIICFCFLELSARVYSWKVGKGFIEKPKSFTSVFFTLYDWPAPFFDQDYFVFKKNERVRKEKEKNEIRIICFGGSTTLNERNIGGLSYSELLESKLKREFPKAKIRVLNAGGDGFSSSHTLVNFVLRCLPLDPDIVTFYHNINDLSANFYGERILSDYSNKYMSDDFLAYRFRSGIFGTLTHFSFFFRWVNSKTKYFRTRKIDYSKDFSLGKITFQNNLKSFFSIARDRGIFAAFGTQAGNSKIRDRRGFLEYNSLIREFASRNKIPLFDLERYLMQDRFFVDQVHFSEEGVRLAAEEIFKVLSPLVKKIAEKNDSNKGKGKNNS